MNHIGLVGFLGLCFVYFLQVSITGGLSPALQGIADGMGMDVNTVGLIQTIPGIFGIISSILIGKLVGTKIKYKTALLGMLVLALIGAVPLVITNWPLMVFSRICLGFSLGAYYALPPALLMKYFSGDKLRSRLGIGNIFSSAGSAIMMFVSGLLVVVNWKLPFVIFLLPLIPLFLLIIDLPEPEPVAAPVTPRKKKNAPIGAAIIINCITGAAIICLGTVALQAISVVVIGRGFGTGTEAGIAALFFNISGMILSALFAVLYKTFKKMLTPIIMLVIAVGLLLLYFAANMVMVGVAMFLVGAVLLMFPSILSDNAKLSTPENTVFVTGLQVAVGNMGVFCVGPFMILASKAHGLDVPGPLFAGIVLGILAFITVIIRAIQKEPKALTAA